MLCYAVLCYAMLCYAMLCYALLCFALLCFAMLCRPTVLGWDERAWLGGARGARKPWFYHLGAKLALPLHYLRSCAFPNETLVLFTDHDALFRT